MAYQHTDKIIDVAIEAMTEAAKEYSSKWNNGWFAPWTAPEYIYTTAIARALSDKRNKLGHVYCEQNMREVISWSKKKGKKSGRFPKSASKFARVDIVVADPKDENYRFCLEVKRYAMNLGNIGEDIIRCANIIEKSTRPQTVSEGAVIFLTHHKRKDAKKWKCNRQRLEKRIEGTLVGRGRSSEYKEKIEELRQKQCRDYFVIEPHYCMGNFGSCNIYNDKGAVSGCEDWVAAAVKISLPNQRRKLKS